MICTVQHYIDPHVLAANNHRSESLEVFWNGCRVSIHIKLGTQFRRVVETHLCQSVRRRWLKEHQRRLERDFDRLHSFASLPRIRRKTSWMPCRKSSRRWLHHQCRRYLSFVSSGHGILYIDGGLPQESCSCMCPLIIGA